MEWKVRVRFGMNDINNDIVYRNLIECNIGSIDSI